MIRNAMWVALGGLGAWLGLQAARDPGLAGRVAVAGAELARRVSAVAGDREEVPPPPERVGPAGGAVQPGAGAPPAGAAVPGPGVAEAGPVDGVVPADGAEEPAGQGEAGGGSGAWSEAAGEGPEGPVPETRERRTRREAEQYDVLRRVLKAYEEGEGRGGR